MPVTLSELIATLHAMAQLAKSTPREQLYINLFEAAIVAAQKYSETHPDERGAVDLKTFYADLRDYLTISPDSPTSNQCYTLLCAVMSAKGKAACVKDLLAGENSLFTLIKTKLERPLENLQICHVNFIASVTHASTKLEIEQLVAMGFLPIVSRFLGCTNPSFNSFAITATCNCISTTWAMTNTPHPLFEQMIAAGIPNQLFLLISRPGITDQAIFDSVIAIIMLYQNTRIPAQYHPMVTRCPAILGSTEMQRIHTLLLAIPFSCQNEFNCAAFISKELIARLVDRYADGQSAEVITLSLKALAALYTHATGEHQQLIRNKVALSRFSALSSHSDAGVAAAAKECLKLIV